MLVIVVCKNVVAQISQTVCIEEKSTPNLLEKSQDILLKEI